MKQKILSFIVCKGKFLALRNNSKNTKHGGDFWFTVTGSVEDNEIVRKNYIKELSNKKYIHNIPINRFLKVVYH